MYNYQFNSDTDLGKRADIVIKDHIFKEGNILTDDEYELEPMWGDGNWLRIRTIEYDGHIYYHKMIDGKVVEFKELI